MIGEVIAIGDELTTGQRLDTNSQWLSQRLTEIGVRVLYHTTVADDLDANIAVFRGAIGRADVVVATGGLGPTADDLTRDAIASAVGVELVQNDAALAHIRNMFESRGRTMPPRNAAQARFPHGSLQITNANGTAPGIAMEIARPVDGPCRLFALPGVPAEMHSMWKRDVAPTILSGQPERRVTRHRRIHCFGAGESHIEELLGDLIRRGREPLVGITASSATITLRITATGSDEADCLQGMEPTAALIRKKLGMLVFGEEEDELQHAVLRLLHERAMTIACVESATRGLIAEWFNGVPEAPDNFVGSCVKKIPASRAEEAATTARSDANADFGLAVSDVTLGDRDVAVVKVALATTHGVRGKEYPMFGDAEFARIRTAKLALNDLRVTLARDE